MTLEPADLVQARDQFKKAGLVLPTVPAELQLSFHRIEDWLYGSRDVAFWDLYSFTKYPLEAVQSKVPDYVAIGHVGHGVNAYVIVYHLVYGRVACFVQVAWGGIYMDEPETTSRARRKLEQCSRLVETIEGRRSRGRRLVVMDSDIAEIHLCEFLPVSFDTVDATEWIDRHRNASTDPIGTAIGRLAR